MAHRQFKATRFSGLRFTLLCIALCCLLAVTVIGCGPSEQDIEATVVAGIQASATAVTVESTATAIANLPPTATSPAGLQLPIRLRPSSVPHEKMSLEEARRMYREIGCTGCATRLATGLPENVNQDHDDIVLTGAFLGDDSLPDSIVIRIWEGGTVVCVVLINTGVSLEQYTNFVVDHNNGNTKEESDVLFQATSEGYELLNVNDYVLLILGIDLKNGGRQYGITNLTTNTDGTLAGIYHWYGDFDNDNEIEVGLLQEDNSLRIIETDRLTTNGEATSSIALAAKDFASNLLTDDSADFEALWREHRPSASVAALALILDTPFPGLLDRLYAAVDNGEDLRETVLAIRQSRR